jgi:hypothetical protein
MRLVALGPEPSPDLAEALAAAGFTLERRALPAAAEAGRSAGLAAALRASDAALSDPPEVALVTAAGPEGLMAAVTAVKLCIPTAVVGAPEEGQPPLAGRVAHLWVERSDDAQAAARRIGAIAAPTLPER